jgi:hypothetical protein
MEQLAEQSPWLLGLLILIMVWTIPWKLVALWKAARNGHKYWFGAIFIFNTVALLEVIYIFFFANKKGSSEELIGNGSSRNVSANLKKII